jgi:signal transduction histidine kinase
MRQRYLSYFHHPSLKKVNIIPEKRDVAKTVCFLFMLLFCFNTHVKSQITTAYIDSLNESSLQYIDNVDSTALKILNQSLKEAASIKYSFGIMTAYNRMGVFHFMTSNLDSARVLYLKSYDVAIEIPDSSHAIKMLGNIAIIDMYQGNLEQAIKNQFIVIEHLEKKKDPHLTSAYADLASMYYYLQQFDQSLEAAHKANNLAKELEDKRVIATSSNTLGVLYESHKKDYKKAEKYYLESLAIKKEMGLKKEMLSTVLNLNGLPDYRDKEVLIEAVEIAKELNLTDEIVFFSMNIGVIYSSENNFLKASEYFIIAKDLAEKNALTIRQREVYKKLAINKWRLGDSDGSIEYWEKYADITDSIYKHESIEKIAEMETLFETKQREAELVEERMLGVERENKILEQNKLISYLIIAVLFIIAAGSIFLIYRKNKQRIIQHQIRIDEQEKGFRRVVMAQEEERQRIAAELHDNVGQQLNVLKRELELLKVEVGNENETLQIIEKNLDVASNDVREISHQMMPKALTENGLIHALGDLIDSVARVSEIQFTFEHYDSKENVPKEIEVSLFRICQELLNNILKHAQASEVHVFLHKRAKSIVLIIEDNGRGIADSNTEGIGVLNIKKRIELLRGKFSIQPGEQTGTFVNIQIPLND